MKYKIVKIVRKQDCEVSRQLTNIKFDDVYEALDFIQFTTSKQDRQCGIEYHVCPVLVV